MKVETGFHANVQDIYTVSMKCTGLSTTVVQYMEWAKDDGGTEFSFALCRLKQEFSRQLVGLNLGIPPEVLEQAVIEKILMVQWTPAEEEAPDGWLDYDACEDRLLRGVGDCKRITT